MAERSAPRNETVMQAGRLLIAAFVAGYLLDTAEILPVPQSFDLEILVLLSVGIGLFVVTSRHKTRLSAVTTTVRSTAGIDELVLLTTRNVIVLYVCLILLSATRLRIHQYVNDSLLFYVTLLLLALSVVLVDDERTIVATKAGAVLALVTVILPVFSETFDAYVTTRTYVLALVLVGLVCWQRGEPRSPSTVNRTRTSVGVSRFAISIGLLTVLATVLYSYRLGELHLQGDEYLVVDAAASYYHTGELYQWNWIASEQASRYYDRAWPHTLLVAASYAVFGISEFSARIVSVLFGILCVPISYVVTRYFTEQRTVALATSAAIVVYPSTLFYFRWARMYALLIPLFLVLTYLTFRVTTEGNSIDFRNERLNATIDRYFDFNLSLGLVTLPVLYISYQIHYNALGILAATYVYVLYRATTTRERKFQTASGVGIVGIVVVALLARYTEYADFLEQFLSFFARENTIYLEYLLQFPFEMTTGVVLFVVGFAIVSRTEKASLRQKLIYLYTICIFSLVFYVYIGDRYASFAYIVHVVPIAIALVLYVYVDFVRSIKIPVVRIALALLLVTSMVYPIYAGTYSRDYEQLYYEDSEDFTTAYGTIVDDFDSEDDVLIAQYARDYYLRELPDGTTWVSMKNNQRYEPDEFYEDIQHHGSGWITWETGKSYHVHPEVRDYVDEHFEQHHGSGIDDTGVEVYYFDERMIERE